MMDHTEAVQKVMQWCVNHIREQCTEDEPTLEYVLEELEMDEGTLFDVMEMLAPEIVED